MLLAVQMEHHLKGLMVNQTYISHFSSPNGNALMGLYKVSYCKRVKISIVFIIYIYIYIYIYYVTNDTLW